MRCQRIVALALLAAFVLAISAPVFAWNGGGSGILAYIKDHPWQDDNHGGEPLVSDQIIKVVFGPFTFNIKIPASTTNLISKTDHRTLVDNKSKQVSTSKQTQTKAESRKGQ